MEGMKISKRMNKRFYLIFLVIVIGSCIFTIKSYGGKRMEQNYLYELDLKNARELKPLKYTLDRSTSISLFPVPQDNSVGTNDMNNAITLISFHKGGFFSSGKERLSLDKYFKNAVYDIGGGGQYLPVISKDVIGFGQTRSFLIYDFKKKIHREYTIVVSLAKTIEKVAIADARQRRFIFEIEAHNSRSNDPWDISNTLKLMDLSGQEVKLINEVDIGSVTTWAVANNKNLLYNLKTKKLQVLNMDLEPALHPIENVIKRNNTMEFIVINAHPNLPFAILSGGKNGAIIVPWEPNRDTSPHILFNSTYQFSFSPDGKWVTFKKSDYENDTNKTYLMPVSEKYPHYLGSPILLLNDYFNDIHFAWTTNPISFVGSSLNHLYRWDLENRDFPGKGKMSFHDYIVQEDLKKLAREKRQGLGNK